MNPREAEVAVVGGSHGFTVKHVAFPAVYPKLALALQMEEARIKRQVLVPALHSVATGSQLRGARAFVMVHRRRKKGSSCRKSAGRVATCGVTKMGSMIWIDKSQRG